MEETEEPIRFFLYCSILIRQNDLFAIFNNCECFECIFDKSDINNEAVVPLKRNFVVVCLELKLFFFSPFFPLCPHGPYAN